MAFQQEWIQITITDKKEGILNGERDVRILYVYEGTAVLSLNNVQITLSKDDFYAVNSGDRAEYALETTGFVAILQLKYPLVADYLELRRYYLVCTTLQEHGVGEERIGIYLRSIFSNELSGDPARKALLMSEIYGLLFLLHENCRVRKTLALLSEKEEENKRVERIRSFLLENYNERISLEDLSKETYFSIPYLSRYIKRNFGRNFSEVLLDLRLEHAVNDLKDADITITSVALDNGFASPTAFTGFFREKYGMTPSEYRKKYLEEHPEETDSSLPEKTDLRLVNIVKERSLGEDIQMVNARELLAKVSEARPFKRFWNRMINGGTAHDLMRADMQEHLLLLKKELDIEYVRFWDLHSQEMMLYDGNPERTYNFTRLDRVVDFLRRNQMRPYIEIGPKPNILLKNTHEYLVVERRERIAETPEQYGEFVEQLARHYVRRYGIEEVETWYFELWLETYSSDIHEYLTVFETVQKHLKKISPKLRLGGVGSSNETSIPMEDVVKRWADLGQAPDFFTFYSYPYISQDIPIAYEARTPENAGRALSANFVEKLMKEKTAMFRENGFWNQEVHISEWNSTC